MARVRRSFECLDCGGEAPTWTGQCPACGAWNTLEERAGGAAGARPGRRASTVPFTGATDEPPEVLSAIAPDAHRHRPTGLDEVDRVLGGGLVPGSVTVVGGEPGVGKSTLLLQVAAAATGAGGTALYVSAEESRQQVRLRAERLRVLSDRVLVSAETSLPAIIDLLDTVEPKMVVIDSVQTVSDPELSSAPGTVTQVRQVAARVAAEARARGIATVLVGHVTKEGSLAGPRVLEHLVDTVLSFEGDRHQDLRFLRASKHRFGSTAEIGVFEMTGTGLATVVDPSSLFLADRQPGLAGSAVVPTLQGHRPFLVEVQALVASSSLASPRRSAQGIDSGRLGLLLAVLAQRVGLTPIPNSDVYALAVGGARVVEPGADLGVALAVASATTDVAIPSDLVACAEVGLAGELRQVSQTERRLSEAARLGFSRVILPVMGGPVPDGLHPIRVATLGEALQSLGVLVGPDRASHR